jgi:CubicO group peptidase (beta-lactamase class C family)
MFFAAVTLAASGTARAADTLEGSWDFSMDREGDAIPRVCMARLQFQLQGNTWLGAIRFRRILKHRTVRLTDLVITKKRFEARVQAPEVSIVLTGALKDGVLTGHLEWRGYDTFPWMGTRPDLLFEPGLKFSGSMSKGGITSAKVDGPALHKLVVAARDSYSDALVVVKNGRILCERTFGQPRGKLHTMSVTKFVMALGIAMLLEEEKIASLDAPLSTWFPEYKDGLKGKVTLRHVMTHTSGIHHEKSAAKLNAARDRVAYALAQPVDVEPGTVHSYNNVAVAILSGIFPRVVKMQADEYIARKILKRLRIKEWSWNRDAAGTTVGYAELIIGARDLARIGKFVADRGMVGGKPVIAESRLREFSSPATDLVKDQGLLWRLILDEKTGKSLGVYHTGWLGQWIVVMPESKLIGVRLRRFEDARENEIVEYEFGRFLTMLRALPR